MKIMVTGAEGFIGSHLVRTLGERDHDVLGVDREIDVTKMISVGTAMSAFHPEVVIHCAAIANVAECDRNRRTAFQTNVIGTFTTASAAVAYGVRRFIYFSTGGHMYGSRDVKSWVEANAAENAPPFRESDPTNPPSYYGETKLMSEAALAAAIGDSAMEPVILRPSNVYGPGGRGACEVIAQTMLDGGIVRVTGNGHQTRDYVHIDDVARLVVRVTEVPPFRQLIGPPMVFNVGTGRATSVNDITFRLRELLDWNGEVAHEAARPFDPDHVQLDAHLAQLTFGWEPRIAFADGIEAVIPVRA